MDCDLDITFVFNANGTVTLTNPNTDTATVTLTPAHTGFPVTIQASGNFTFTLNAPDVTGSHCWQIGAECGVVSSALAACALVTPDAAQEFTVIVEATNGTGPYTYSGTIMLPEQGNRTIPFSGSGSGVQLGSHTFDRVNDIIPPDEVVIVTTTVTDSTGATDTDTFTYQS